MHITYNNKNKTLNNFSGFFFYILCLSFLTVYSFVLSFYLINYLFFPEQGMALKCAGIFYPVCCMHVCEYSEKRIKQRCHNARSRQEMHLSFFLVMEYL